MARQPDMCVPQLPDCQYAKAINGGKTMCQAPFSVLIWPGEISFFFPAKLLFSIL